jgi:hypothetical protein
MRRIRTNTPLQALVTLNDPVYVEAAQALARRIVREGGASVDERMQYAMHLCVARPPDEKELASLALLYESTKARLADKPEAALSLATPSRWGRWPKAKMSSSSRRGPRLETCC